MSAWIKKIHMYTGLLNFTMLCVFGLAGLVATAEAPDIFEPDTVPAATIFAFRVPGSASDGRPVNLSANGSGLCIAWGPTSTGMDSINP
jgi:hypothetical protein